MIFYSKLTPVVYTSVKDCGVMLTIRYLCEPRKRRGSEQGIWEDILDAFAAHDNIDFAYPTQRFYDNA
ncbi:MAG: mechanosensitive ion channel family protein, partial [Gammaproteobacteria bacterium]|nr:mechanosensitive ion channel family protein [Gammaproteobacteria bacterium]NIR25722.1 mechanosensitive ion channel family protein [Gammaproteobacteria bacterium]